ncbi:MAG: hypothetical protein ABIH41_04460 [Nanoarchaeota archaeon]
MKHILYALFVIAVVITACTTTSYVCPDGREVSDASKCSTPADVPPTSPEQSTETPAVDDSPEQPVIDDAPADESLPPMSEEARAVVEMSKGKNINSYSFSYFGPPNPSYGYDADVRGTLMRVKLPVSELLTKYIDTIYLDMEAKTAKGYCLGQDPLCLKNPDAATGKTVVYADYIFKLPFAWLGEIPYADVRGTEKIDGRNGIRLEYTKEGDLHNVWIDNFWGIPLKIKIGQDNKGLADDYITYEYRNLAVNGVTQQEVTAP